LIQFGKERTSEGAGPVTLGIDLACIKTILTHAAAVHGVVVAIEPINLARVTLGRLGLIGTGNERDRRPTQGELNLLIASFGANPSFSIEQAALITGHKDWKMLGQYTHLKPEASHGAALKVSNAA
jgi:hypothetical protein